MYRGLNYNIDPFETIPCEAFRIMDDGSTQLIGSYNSRSEAAKRLGITKKAVTRTVTGYAKKTRHKDGYWITIKNKCNEKAEA